MKKKLFLIILALTIILFGTVLTKKENIKAEELTYYNFNLPILTTRPAYNYVMGTYSNRRFNIDGTNQNYTTIDKALGIATNGNTTIYHISSTYERSYYDSDPDNIFNEFIIENNGTQQRVTISMTWSNNNTQETTGIGANTTVLQNLNLVTARDLLTLRFEKTQNFDTAKTRLGAYYTNLFQPFFQESSGTIQLETPTITLNFNTIHWEYIENANYYNIFKNGDLVGRTYYNSWVTIENGIYTVQACTNNNEEFSNSELSNSITQNNYNDMIGNGVNWFTLMSAIVDSQIYLMKSLLNYTIWDINFFQLFTFIITIIITIGIIKFIKGW